MENENKGKELTDKIREISEGMRAEQEYISFYRKQFDMLKCFIDFQKENSDQKSVFISIEKEDRNWCMMGIPREGWGREVKKIELAVVNDMLLDAVEKTMQLLEEHYIEKMEESKKKLAEIISCNGDTAF